VFKAVNINGIKFFAPHGPQSGTAATLAKAADNLIIDLASQQLIQCRNYIEVLFAPAL